MILPVTSFPDSAVAVVQGLKNRFAALGGEFANTRVATLKDESNAAQHEVIVLATGGQETHNGTVKRVPVSLLVFASDYGTANRLAAQTAEFLKSLPALKGSIHWAEVTNSGEHIESPGSQQCRNVIGTVFIRSSKTTLY